MAIADMHFREMDPFPGRHSVAQISELPMVTGSERMQIMLHLDIVALALAVQFDEVREVLPVLTAYHVFYELVTAEEFELLISPSRLELRKFFSTYGMRLR